MSYTETEFNYYVKKPKQINATLDESLLLALVDINSSWFSYMKPHTLDMVKKVIAVDPTTFEYADRTVFTIQYLEEVIDTYPFLIQYVYIPNDDLIKVALRRDLNVLQHLKKIPSSIQEWILSQNGMILEHIDAAEQTEELVEIAIRENINAYRFAHIKTLALDLIVLEQDPTRVDMISDYHPELIDYLVAYNPRFITKFFDHPDNIVTEELKRIAIDKDPLVYKLMPNPDMDLMKYAALVDLTLMDSMPYNQELIDYVLERNGLALKYVRKKDLRTIRKAIENNVLALNYVDYPRDFLIEYAFSIDGIAVQFITNPTEAQYLNAIQRNGYAIEFIPPEAQTAQMQVYALSAVGTFAIPYLVNPANDDIIMEMIRKEPGYIFRIDNPSNAMLMTAFNSTGQLMLFFENWEARFDNEVIEAALSEDGTILEKVENKTKGMIMTAIGSYPASIQWVTTQDLEMAKAAVEGDPRTLFFIDQSIMDEDLLELALEIDPDYFTRTEGEMTWEQWLELTGQG